MLGLFEQLGLTPPEDDWADRIEPVESLAAACAAAVEGEIENAEMYDRLLGQVSHPDVRRVLMNLQAASRDNHLPAFQRCLQRESAEGRGRPERGPDGDRGPGRGPRHGSGRGRRRRH